MKLFNKSIRCTDFINDKYIKEVSTYRSHRYIMSFLNLSRKIKEYESLNDKKAFTNSFTEEFTEDFLYFLKLRYEHRANTIRTIYNKLSVVLRAAERAGYNVCLGFSHIAVNEEDVSAIYLDEAEIEKVYHVALSHEADIIRDRFIIGCCTALRYSDYSRLRSENINEDNILIKTQKTGVVVRIPLHRYVREILTKYNNELPPPTSQQNFNKVIKGICKKAGINAIIHIERTVGFSVVSRNYEKWQLVSSHTARRSGATNMYLAGIPTFRIMLLTGHKTEKSFFKYIRISQQENVNVLLNHVFFK